MKIGPLGRRRLWPACWVAILAAFFVVPCGAADLSGVVTDSKGEPLSGATVMVLTARPRIGLAVFCPSCYVECSRSATTGPDGKYSFKLVDPSLLFRLAAVADGYRAQIIGDVDADAKPTNIKLEPLPADVQANCRVRGRVIDSLTEKPVAGATIEPMGRKTADDYILGPVSSLGVDALAVTNREGEFVITAREPALAYDVVVKSPRHAPKRFSQLPVGDNVKQNTLTLQVGCAVRGRLMKDGQPAAGVPVGIAGADRTAGAFVGRFEAGTDAAGNFEFMYLPPEAKYYLYSRMDGMKTQAALPLETVQVGKSLSTVELGERQLGVAHRVAGRIRLTDDAKISTPIQILLSCDQSGDALRAKLSEDGGFRFECVPDGETMTITARIPGYHLATSRTSLRFVYEGMVGLTIHGPRDDIEIWFEPNQK